MVVPVVLGVATGDTPSLGLGRHARRHRRGDPRVRAGAERRRLAAAGDAGGGAALGFGLALFFLDRGARESTLLTLWGMRLTSVPSSSWWAWCSARRRGNRPGDPALLAIGCGDLVANGLFAFASSRGQVSVASVLGSLYPVSRSSGRASCSTSGSRVQQVGVALAVGGAALTAL